MSRRRQGQRVWIAAPLLAVALSRNAAAVPNDRLAIEILPNESALDAALAFERACFRAGIIGAHARPLQQFTHAQASFIRLSVEGPDAVRACLTALEPGRRGVTGETHWFDGFAGGLLVNLPPGQNEDRVPDTVWRDPNAPVLEAPSVDSELFEPLARGSAEAIQKLNKLPIESAVVHVEALASRGGPGPLAVLEQIGRQHPHWRVRLAAIEGLNPLISVAALMDVAKRDASWEVRLTAVQQLQTMANSVDPLTPARSTEAARLVTSLIEKDASWEVRRQAIWTLSNELVTEAKETLRERIKADSQPQVRAAALEALAGAHQLTPPEVKRALEDTSPQVRAVAALTLSLDLRKADEARVLWKALNDPDRMVRLAAAGFLLRIQDASIGPQLWKLYLEESELMDADVAFQSTVLIALERAPYPELSALVEARLDTPLPPDERRLLGRLFSKLNPSAAATRFLAEMQSSNALTRSIAADVAPPTPETKARRLALLEDSDNDVRAGAVLGLCRTSDGAGLLEQVNQVSLDPTPLGQEAALARPRCGTPEPSMPLLQTALEAPAAAMTGEDAAFWPALAGIILMFLSVFVIKFQTAGKLADQVKEGTAPPSPDAASGGEKSAT